MEKLPLALVSSVVSFAELDYSEEVVPNTGRFPTDSLRKLALVCKTWFALMRELAAQLQQSTLTLKFQCASREELLKMRRVVIERGRQVVDLRVSMGDVGSFGEFFRTRFRLPTDLDTLELGWTAVMAHLPNLRRLDLSQLPLTSKHAVELVEAAANCCADLEALVLPGKEHHEMKPGAEVEPFLQTVYRALEKWNSTGYRRGLRQLRMPTMNEANRFQSCKEFIDHVVVFCPQVEYLDGFKHSLCEMDRLTSHDMWPMTLENWKKFNATCTNLREFNWVVAPFGDAYFRVFGEHVKPRLTKLCLGVNMLWDWSEYFLGCDKAANLLVGHNIVPIDRPGFGYLATDASPALRGCPSLEELEIALYHPLSEEELDDPFNQNRHYFPVDESVPAEIFGDHFFETLATCCPQVTRIALWEVLEGEDNPVVIHSFTDRGLVALAKLKYLDFMELRPVSCSGNGLYAFLNRLSDEFTGQRTFQICLGGFLEPLSFYDALMSLLVQIAIASPEALRMLKQKFVLRLRNSSLAPVERDWSVDYLAKLKQQVTRVNIVHPSLRLRITSFGFNNESFKSIVELGMYTDHAVPSVWFGWDDDESDRDVVFVNRGGTPHEDDEDIPSVESFGDEDGPHW